MILFWCYSLALFLSLFSLTGLLISTTGKEHKPRLTFLSPRLRASFWVNAAACAFVTKHLVTNFIRLYAGQSHYPLHILDVQQNLSLLITWCFIATAVITAWSTCKNKLPSNKVIKISLTLISLLGLLTCIHEAKTMGNLVAYMINLPPLSEQPHLTAKESALLSLLPVPQQIDYAAQINHISGLVLISAACLYLIETKYSKYLKSLRFNISSPSSLLLVGLGAVHIILADPSSWPWITGPTASTITDHNVLIHKALACAFIVIGVSTNILAHRCPYDNRYYLQDKLWVSLLACIGLLYASLQPLQAPYSDWAQSFYLYTTSVALTALIGAGITWLKQATPPAHTRVSTWATIATGLTMLTYPKIL